MTDVHTPNVTRLLELQTPLRSLEVVMNFSFERKKPRAALVAAERARKVREERRRTLRVASQLQSWMRGAMLLRRQRAALTAQLRKRCIDTVKVLVMLRAKTKRPSFALPLKAVMPLVGLARIVVQRRGGRPQLKLPSSSSFFAAIAPSLTAAQIALIAEEPTTQWRLRWLIDLALRDLECDSVRGVACASYVAISALWAAASALDGAAATSARRALGSLDLRRWSAVLCTMHARDSGAKANAALFAAALAPFTLADDAAQRARAADALVAGPFTEWGSDVLKQQWQATVARLLKVERLRAIADVAWSARATRALSTHAERGTAARSVALNCSTLSVLCAMACSPAALRSHRVGAAFLERSRLHVRLREWRGAVADSSRVLSVLAAPASTEERTLIAAARMLRSKAFQRLGRRAAARVDLEVLVAAGSGKRAGLGLGLWRLASRDLKLLAIESKMAKRRTTRVKRDARRAAQRRRDNAPPPAPTAEEEADEARRAASAARKKEKRRGKRARQKARRRAAKEAALEAAASARGAAVPKKKLAETAEEKAARIEAFRADVARLQLTREAQRAADKAVAEEQSVIAQAEAATSIQRMVDAVRTAAEASKQEEAAEEALRKKERQRARELLRTEEAAAAELRAKESEDAAWESVLFDALTGFNDDGNAGEGDVGWGFQTPAATGASGLEEEEEESGSSGEYTSGSYSDSESDEDGDEDGEKARGVVVIDGLDVGYAAARASPDERFFSLEGVEMALLHLNASLPEDTPRAVAMVPRRLIEKLTEDDAAVGDAAAALEARGELILLDVTTAAFGAALAAEALTRSATLVSNDHELLMNGASNTLNYTFAGDDFLLLSALF